MVVRHGHMRLFENGETLAGGDEQQNKERVLMAAASLFANKGYAGTSVREIVEAASVTKPTLYYYFKNKEDLYLKLMDLAMETFSLLLDESLARQGRMRERLIGLFTDLYVAFHENVDLLRLVNSIIYGPRGATPPYDITQQSNHLESVLNEMLDSGIREGELDEQNRPEVVFLLLGVLRSIQVLLVLRLPRQAINPESIASAVHLIFDGAQAARGAIEETEENLGGWSK
jgi:TetR/AcrR family transcriptional regulator